jgi:hypothetical protein
MTVEEAYAEMKHRGWGFARNGRMIAIGPIQNPNFEVEGEAPLIDVYAMGVDPVDTLQRAIAKISDGEKSV